MSDDPRVLEQQARDALSGKHEGIVQGVTKTFLKIVGAGGQMKADKYQAAANLYLQAAIAYQKQNMSKEAGQAYRTAAGIQKNDLNDLIDAPLNMEKAFKMFRKEDPATAIECILATIDCYTSVGKFRRAAGPMETAAEMLEVEMGDRKKAMECYNTAAQWYEDDGAKALANKLYLKEADIAALEGDYYRAVANYEKVADSSLNNHLMKYSIKEYWLKAGLCTLATKDLVAAHRNLEGYKQKDPSFAGQRECQLLTDLTEAVEAGNQEVFTDKLYAYDQMSRLDKWKTEILVRIKNQIEEADNEFS